jgi:glycosyltransferase involved in cell wall biosynthesis
MLELRQSTVRPRTIAALGREISPLSDLVALLQLTWILLRFRPDVVHTHLAKAGLLGRIAARLARARVVVHTFHGNVFHGYFGPRRSAIFIRVERAMGKLSTRLIAISPRQHVELRDLRIADDAKIVDVPLGLDLAPFRSATPGSLRRELRLGDDTPLVGIVARLVPIKGIDMFLEVARRVANASSAHFVVAGGGELSDELRDQASRLGLQDRVAFLGWRSDLASIYADLDVVALTSHNEGTPVSLIEALASAKPVVATAVGGVPDVVAADCGVLVADGDAFAMAEAITRLLADRELRERMGLAGRGRVLARYDADALVRAIDSLYSQLLGTSRP